jgi:hypothetical protein
MFNFEYAYVNKADTKIIQFHPVPEDLKNWYKVEHKGEDLRNKAYDIESKTFKSFDKYIPPKTKIKNLVLEYNGDVFDANTQAKNDMVACVLVMEEHDVMDWKLNNNEIIKIDIKTLKLVLKEIVVLHNNIRKLTCQQ